MTLFQTGISIAGGLLTVLIVYLLFRSRGVAVWGWVASFLPDSPAFILLPLGAASLGNVLLLSHTLGILVFPLLLAFLDMLLIEVGWLRYVTWLPYPRYLRTLERIESIVERLEKYHALPRPERVKRVFTAGVIASAIHLLLNLWVGAL